MFRRTFAALSAVLGLLYVVSDACTANAADQAPPAVKAKPIVDIPFFFVNDNRLSYSYTFSGTDAGYYKRLPNGTYSGKTTFQTLAFTHFDAWAYGTNFLNVLVNKSGHTDAASPCFAGTSGLIYQGGFNFSAADCAGTTAFVGQIRSTFGFNEIFDTKAFSVGPLKNVSFEIGGDMAVANNYVAPSKRDIVAGLQFQFALPYKGYINVAPLYYQEVSHNAFAQCGAPFVAANNCDPNGVVRFNPTYSIEMNYYMDLGFLPPEYSYFAISGYFTYRGAKGPLYGLPGMESTKPEIISEPIRLTFDAGKALWGNKWTHELDLWTAYRYGRNQYGYNENSAPQVCTLRGIPTNACEYSTAVVGATVKF